MAKYVPSAPAHGRPHAGIDFERKELADMAAGDIVSVDLPNGQKILARRGDLPKDPDLNIPETEPADVNSYANVSDGDTYHATLKVVDGPPPTIKSLELTATLEQIMSTLAGQSAFHRCHSCGEIHQGVLHLYEVEHRRCCGETGKFVDTIEPQLRVQWTCAKTGKEWTTDIALTAY